MDCLALGRVLLARAGPRARWRHAEWHFDVSLDGRPIGEHRFTLRERGDLRELTSEARFRVRILFIDAYRYEHRARERWQGDCLERLDARTDDNGKPTVVAGERAGDDFACSPVAPPPSSTLRADFRLLEPAHPRCDAAAESADRRIRADVQVLLWAAKSLGGQPTERYRLIGSGARRWNRPLVHAGTRVARARIAHAGRPPPALLEITHAHPVPVVLTMSILTLLGAAVLAPAHHHRAARRAGALHGRWYVIANIPTSIEREAHNAVESYRLDTRRHHRDHVHLPQGRLRRPAETYCPRGFVRDTRSNAVWGMRFIWPIKADYRIVYVSDDYQRTIVGREKRDYVWIMARTPQIPASRLSGPARSLAREGYDMSKVASRAAAVARKRERAAAQRRGGVLVKIAIIGSGIAGNVAAYHLHREHDITVFEAGEPHRRAHAHARDRARGPPVAVDTGFIVCNDRTYPNFLALLAELGVELQPSEMSFSVQTASGLEYNGTTLNSLFAQRRNLVRPSFWRMIRDILRFNREAPRLLESPDDSLRLGDYLRGATATRRSSSSTTSCRWAPRSGAPARNRCATFPARYFVRFFHNHGMLSVDDRPQWLTVRGGSARYVEKLTAGFRDRIRLRTPVECVRRSPPACS